MKNNTKVTLLALLNMAFGGSVYPMIKIGYKAFGINAGSSSDVLMFASISFIISGLFVCAFSCYRKEKLEAPKLKNVIAICIQSLFAIVLHYAFTYIGLTTTDSSKTALIKQLGSLIYICFAFLFFKNERFSSLKIVGAIVGFCGIIAINYSSEGIKFSMGDILIICSSFSTVVGNIISKKTAQNCSPFWITGISQLFGGLVLLAAALVMGAQMLHFTVESTFVFAYICLATIAAYSLWYYVLKDNNLSNLFIIKFTEPLFACVFGAILLGEEIFKIQYILAFILISAGILLGNKSEKAEETKNISI